MNKLKISIAAVFAALSFILGLYIANDNNSDLSEGQTTGQTVTEVQPADRISINSLRDFNDAIVNIAERANPAVVTITTTQTVRVTQRSPFSFFFDDQRFNQEREFQRSGLGSGVIVSEDGYIITNNHVIDNADEIRVLLYDGDELDAEIIGTDPASDIAVLQVNSNGNLTSINLGDSDAIRVGEMVLAIGSPLDPGLAHTVSQGIVSAKGRSTLGLNAYENYIQTDAAINPGNSGGALINIDGELVGINTAIASRTGGSQGIGFAIPVNMVQSVMDALITEGRVVRGFLGIYGTDVDRTMARALGLEQPRGIVIGEVEPESPAARAGLEEGDVILTLNGERILNYMNFRVEIGNRSPGDQVTLEVYRDNETLTYDVELGEFEAEEVAGRMTPDEREELRNTLGFTVEELTDSIRNQLNLRTGYEGVLVSEISQNSNAYRQGLRRGDVISQIGDQVVTNPEEFYGSVQALIQQEIEATLLRVNRQGRSAFIAIEL